MFWYGFGLGVVLGAVGAVVLIATWVLCTLAADYREPEMEKPELEELC